MSDHTPNPVRFEASQFLGRIIDSFSSPHSAIYNTWYDGEWTPSNPVYDITTRSFNLARHIRRAVLALGGFIIFISPEYRAFLELAIDGNDRFERHAVLVIRFALDGDS